MQDKFCGTLYRFKMNGSAVNAVHAHRPINTTTRHAGSARRIHVQDAYAFHALVATGCACRSNSLASISGRGTGAAIVGVFSTLGGADLRNAAGMVRFAPQ